jgi:hypothetical protein
MPDVACICAMIVLHRLQLDRLNILYIPAALSKELSRGTDVTLESNTGGACAPH